MKTILRMSRSAAGGLVLAAFALGLLGGCGTFDPVVDATRFYTLSPVVTTASTVKSDAPAVQVRVRSVAAHLDRKEMAVRMGAHELAYAPSDVWAEALDEGVTRAIIESLRIRLGDRAVVAQAPRVRAKRSAVLVEIDLLTCEGRSGAPGTAVVAADWRVMAGEPGGVVASGRFAAEKPGWNAGDYAALASMLGTAVDDLAAALMPPVSAALGG